MNPAILARVNYRLRTSELVSTDWDDDEVITHRTAPRRRPRTEISDRALLAIAGVDGIRRLVRHAFKDLDDRAQERIVASLERRRVRLHAQARRVTLSARSALTPKVHAVKAATAAGRKEEA